MDIDQELIDFHIDFISNNDLFDVCLFCYILLFRFRFCFLLFLLNVLSFTAKLLFSRLFFIHVQSGLFNPAHLKSGHSRVTENIEWQKLPVNKTLCKHSLTSSFNIHTAVLSKVGETLKQQIKQSLMLTKKRFDRFILKKRS